MYVYQECQNDYRGVVIAVEDIEAAAALFKLDKK